MVGAGHHGWGRSDQRRQLLRVDRTGHQVNDDAEAISMNPAGIAKSKGTVVTVGIAALDYIMSFQRNGNYPTVADDALPYEGQRYALMENK